MATYTPLLFELLEADQKDIFYKRIDMIQELFSQLFQRRPSTKAYEDGLRIGALGTFQEKPEGTPIAFDDPVQGTRIRTIHAVYALGYRISKEMRDDDQHGIVNQLPEDLADSAKDHMERIAWDVINDGYTGTRHTGLENEVLFSATHSLIKTGGTASNILAPPIALSQSGLEAVMNLADTTTSDEGRFQNLMMDILLIHPNLQHTANILLQTERKPNSANNDINTVSSSMNGLRPLKVPYLSSTTRWSVHASPGSNSLMWFDRNMLERPPMAIDSDTLDAKFYATYRAHATFREWRNNYGSGAL